MVVESPSGITQGGCRKMEIVGAPAETEKLSDGQVRPSFPLPCSVPEASSIPHLYTGMGFVLWG